MTVRMGEEYGNPSCRQDGRKAGSGVGRVGGDNPAQRGAGECWVEEYRNPVYAATTDERLFRI